MAKKFSYKNSGLIASELPVVKTVTLDSEVGVYGIFCDEIPACYIGQSKNIPTRIRSHRYNLRRGSYMKTHKQWQTDFDTFGELGFRFEVIECCDVDELRRKETHHIKKYIEDGWFIYNKELTTTGNSIVSCPPEYVELVKGLIKSLERGAIGINELEHAIYQAQFR